MRARGMIVWWALALASGCNQLLGLDLPEGGDEIADADDVRIHDARVIDGPADRDLDGVFDADDVCPGAADPGQFDEDGDGRGDRCDLCPHLSQANDLDNDEDNIPDACDPYPGTASGHLRFSSFHSADEMSDWSVTGSGSATWSNDEVLLMPVADSEARLLRNDDVGIEPKRSSVIAALTFDAPNPGGIARRAVGVVTHLGGMSGNDFFLCQIETDLPQPDVRLADYRVADAVAATILSTSIGTQFPLGDLTLELDLGADDETTPAVDALCRVEDGMGTRTLPRTGVMELEAGLSGVRTIGVPVRVRWIVVIDHPTLPPPVVETN